MSNLEKRQRRYDRFVERAELPMLVLAVLTIPVVLMPFTEELSPESESALQLLGIAIWVAFAIEYLVLIYLSPHRRQTILTHKLDLALVVLPFLRPLRLAQLARIAHAGTALARAGVAARRLLRRPGFTAIIGTVTGLIVAGGGLVTIAEHDQEGSSIADFGDGLWWAFVTCTTVGYGDTFPVTSTGRSIAVFLMVAGISGLSAITANIAAYFVSADAEEEVDEITERLTRIETQLDSLIAGLSPATTETTTPPDTLTNQA